MRFEREPKKKHNKRSGSPASVIYAIVIVAHILNVDLWTSFCSAAANVLPVYILWRSFSAAASIWEVLIADADATNKRRRTKKHCTYRMELG